MSKLITHRDGTQELFQSEKIIRAIQDIIEPMKLGDPFVPMFKIIKNFELKLPDQVATDEIDRLLLKAMEGLISEDPLYDRIAAAQLAKITNKTVEARFMTFKEYVQFAVEEKLLRQELLEFDLDDLERHLNYERDRMFNFFAMATFEKKYQLRDYQKRPLEKVQRTRMRMAMGIAFVEPAEERNAFAKKLYDQFSQLKYIHSHSFNAGSPRSQMSSCFISVVEDSMDHIMAKATEFAQLSKYDGGMGISFTKLRASWSLIKAINQESSGPIPFIKIYDTIKNAMLQGTGKKRSWCVFYMEPWHYNIYEYLDLKETNGNDYVRTRTCNTALRIPDEFMKRVLNDDDRWLFDPNETPELTESRGEDFEAKYCDAIEQAAAGRIKLTKKVKARQLYRDMLIRLAKTGNYRFCFKDTHNRVNQAASYGLIHSSNLCTEISIANRGDSTAVCTLASVNLAKIVDTDALKKVENKDALSFEEKLSLIKRDDFQETIQTAIQSLDNVVEFNFYPYPDTEKNCKDLRPLGLGVMGFADLLIELRIPYDHHEATLLIDQLGKFMYDNALETSKQLAVKKGPFRDYDPSRYPYEARRNILLLAIAPTASISLLAGVSSGIDSNFGMVYSRENQFGKFTVVVERLIEQLKEKNMRNEEIKHKIIASGGSIQAIEELDGMINKELFKTAYEYSPTSQVNIAAARQKYVDQAISRNMYFDEKYRDTLGDYYMYARQQGLKSTYYCFIEKTIQGEKYTQSVNKRWERAGFSAMTETVMAAASTAQGLEAIVKKAGFGNALTAQTDDLGDIDLKHATDDDRAKIEVKLRAEKGDDYVDQLKAGTLYKDSCPADPYEKLMCEACQ